MNKPITELIASSFECGGRVSLNPSWNDYDIICPQNKLFYVLDGEFIVEIDGTPHLCSKGEMVLIPAGTKHSYYLTKKERAEKYWIHFNLKTNGVDFFSKYTAPLKTSVPFNENIEGLFREIFARANDADANLSISANILQIVDFYIKNASISVKEEAFDEIDRVINYIKNNYSELFSLNQLADMAILTPNYFIRKFKARTGYSPIQYANHIKIEMARFLIANTNTPVMEIMEKVGFLDAAYFCKIFKKHYQYSPRKYREIYGCKPFHLIHRKQPI